MTLLQMLALIGAGAVAGFVNSIAGGGTILTFPTLLLLGVNSISANATSTVALILGTVGSVFGYRKQIPAVRHWLHAFAPVSLLGGLLGSIALRYTPAPVFDRLVPFLLLFATIIFMGQGFIAKHIPEPETGSHPGTKVLCAQFLISLYGGYFGAGVGICMLATLGLMGMRDIHEMNTVKTVVAGLINLVAALYFILIGLIDWPKMFLLASGALPGYLAGSLFAQRISPGNVRKFITCVGLGIAAYLFHEKFVK